jgi:hypothetical protein
VLGGQKHYFLFFPLLAKIIIMLNPNGRGSEEAPNLPTNTYMLFIRQILIRMNAWGHLIHTSLHEERHEEVFIII